MNDQALHGSRTHLGASAAPLQMPLTSASAVSWPAVIAGAVGAAALSLILLVPGTGLGLSSISPWSDKSASTATLGVSTILWITFTQIAAAGLGGYLAGRLRTRWIDTHSDEVYFRDTAHGFLAWGLATIVTAAALTSAIGGIVGSTAQAGATVAAGAAGSTVAMANGMKGNSDNGLGYFVDSLLRKDASATTPATATSPSAGGDDTARASAEIARIFATALGTGSLSPEDTRYLGQNVAQRTGLSQSDAEKRVNDTFARLQSKAKEVETTARDAADKARKASAYAALWLFVSLLVGAFCASLAATFGGRRRDEI